MTEQAHTHHWVPTPTGKRNSAGEPIMEMKCACGMTYAEWRDSQ